SRGNVRKNVLEKSSKIGWFKAKENPNQNNNSFFKNFKKVYPLGIHRSNSSLSVSSISLSLSQTSTDSSLTDYSCPLDQKILLSLESLRKVTATSPEKKDVPVVASAKVEQLSSPKKPCDDNGEVKRCHWITKNSDNAYVTFHDEQWGVPVYDDNQLFELLSMSGMLMDHNWTDILKKRGQLRESFGGFDINFVANMEESEIIEISSNKELGLPECRASYIWGYFNYRPIINKYRYPRNVPLRTPKAEVISKDLVRRGFRLVGPVITQSFIQAAGMTIDHLIDCFRYNECVSLAENPWRHV
uniref:DNA-3-methyladenine glycosylase I n=1 Tax=Chenopodium quinoa TaxID=63459 RepID=A0A803L7M2_CHEQI